MPVIERTLRREAGVTAESATEIANALNAVLADLFALYVKTKNFHWHMTGAHFREYHELLDEQATQILATVDPAAERVRKLGRSTLRSVGQIASLQRIADNESEGVVPADMLTELHDDNCSLVSALRETHDVCDRLGDIATASLIENWIDEADGRIWFLMESVE